jgi:HD-like signal output (HDOD) protein
MIEAESELLEYTHADTGRLLAEKWNLPEMVTEVIEHHHHPEQAGAHAPEAAVVHVADIFCRALGLGSGGDERIPALDMNAWKLLGLRKDNIEAMLMEVESAFSDISTFTEVAAATG